MSYYNHTPAKTFELAASGSAGDSVTHQYGGYGSEKYGFNRLVIGATDFKNIMCKITMNEGESVIVDNIHLYALRHLFLHYSLLSPFIIENNRKMEITLTNMSNEPQRANIQMTGMREQLLNQWIESNHRSGKKILKPVLLHGNAELAPLSNRMPVAFKRRQFDVKYHRLVIASSADDFNDITASLYRYQELLKNDMFINQYNDEFLSMRALVEYEISSNVPVELHLSNLNSSDTHTVSFIAEGYADV